MLRQLHARLTRAFATTSRTHNRFFQLVTLLLVFLILGVQSGAWVVLLADLTAATGMSPAQLGLALTGMSGAGIVSLLLGGQLTDEGPRRPMLVLALLGTAGFFLALSVVTTYTWVIAVFLTGGLFLSLYDLTANTLGGDYEHQHRRPVLTFFHAAWSFGAALGALQSGVALAAGVAYTGLFRWLTGLLLLVGLLAVIAPLPHQARDEHATPGRVKQRVLANRGVLVAALLVVFTFSTDAGLEGYVSLYLRELIGSGALLGGLSVSVLYGAAVLGRLTSGVAIRRFGEGHVLATSGILVCIGLTLVTAFTATPPVVLGLLLIGLALSPVAPIAYSLAARSAPGRVGQATSAVTFFGYSAFLLVPVVVGAVAEASSIRTAFRLLFFTGLGILVLSRLVSPEEP